MKLLNRLYNWFYRKPLDTYRKCKERKLQKVFDHCNPEFQTWAFGKDYDNLFEWDRMNAWNKLHSDLMKIDEVDHVFDSIKKMGQFWADHNAKPK